MESQRLLPHREQNAEDESFEGDWSDKSSYSSYSDSDSESIIPDWEPYVDDFSGELLYIDCHPFVTHNRYQTKVSEEPEAFSKSQLRRSTRGKFLRLLRRRESKRFKKNQKPIEEGIESNTQKVKFQDFQEGEQKEVTLEIDQENRYNLSSDKSLAESLLGLIVSTLSDGNRVMIAGIYLTLVGSIYNVVTQVLFLTLMTFVALQIKALKIISSDYHLYCEPHEKQLGCDDEKYILAILRKVCVKHQIIISFVDQLNIAMKNVLLLEFLLNSLNIASVMIQIIIMPNTPPMLGFCVIFCILQVSQLFLMSWHANEIEIQSISLSDALFQSKWYEHSERAKKIIRIIMLRSRKPLRLFIGPFYPMTIRTALATMKAAYSYVTLIITLASKG